MTTTDPATATAPTDLPTPPRAETLDQLVRATLVDAIRYAIAAPLQITDRAMHGHYPESLISRQARAVESVIKHRAHALAQFALAEVSG